VTDKEVFGGIALVFSVLSYVPYFHGLATGKTRPHVFSWFIWGMMGAICAFAQHVGGAGPGAWVTDLGAVACLVIAGISFFHGEKNITRGDWFCFGASLLALPLWYFTKDPLPAVVLITFIDQLAYYPTLRKSYLRPHEENAMHYVISNIKHVFAFAAMQTYSATTLLWPLSGFLMNMVVILLLVWRRQAMMVKAL
jgi:hypothetical protein